MKILESQQVPDDYDPAYPSCPKCGGYCMSAITMPGPPITKCWDCGITWKVLVIPVGMEGEDELE